MQWWKAIGIEKIKHRSGKACILFRDILESKHIMVWIEDHRIKIY